MTHLLAAQQQEVTAWPQRLALTALMIGIIALVCWGMWRNWHRRAQQKLAVQTVPADFQPVMQVEGFYLGTSPADNWMIRITANGMGAPGRAQVAVGEPGLLLRRLGEQDIYIAGDQIDAVELGRGVAADVAEKDGVVLWFWRAGDVGLQTGFRPDAPGDVARLLGASQQFAVQEDA